MNFFAQKTARMQKRNRNRNQNRNQNQRRRCPFAAAKTGRNEKAGKKMSPAARFWLIFGTSLLPTMAVGAAIGLYEGFLPPLKKQPAGTKTRYGLVLGCGARKDGTPSRSMEKRCRHAVQSWEKGECEALIVSGAAVKNHWVEAEVMKRFIHSLNPDIPVWMETKARSTWENLANTKEIVGDVPLIVYTGSLHGRRAQAMARQFFSNVWMNTYPDRKARHIVREIPSRIKYIELELKKRFL